VEPADRRRRVLPFVVTSPETDGVDVVVGLATWLVFISPA
jgi:hypothetical protein